MKSEEPNLSSYRMYPPPHSSVPLDLSSVTVLYTCCCTYKIWELKFSTTTLISSDELKFVTDFLPHAFVPTPELKCHALEFRAQLNNAAASVPAQLKSHPPLEFIFLVSSPTTTQVL